MRETVIETGESDSLAAQLSEAIEREKVLEGMLERTEAQIHEEGGLIDRMVDGEQSLSELASRVREHEPFHAQDELFCGGCQWSVNDGVGFAEHVLGAQA